MKAKGIRRFLRGAQVGNPRRRGGLFDSDFDRRNDNQRSSLQAEQIKLRPLYAMWMTGKSVTLVGSMPRYSLTMFPIFMLFAVFQKPFLERPDHGLVRCSSWRLCASLSVRGSWAF